MSNAIGRKRSLSIAKEGAYGTASTGTKFILPIMGTPRFEVMANKERNTASLGSSYQADNLRTTERYTELSLSVKVDEDTLPLLFAQNFAITSSAATDSAYTHTLNYSDSNALASYTLFLDDDDRTSEYVAGVRFGEINLTFERGYIVAELTGIGRFPATWTGSNTLAQPNDFVGAHAVFNYDAYTGSKAAYEILSVSVNNSFNLSGDDTNFVLGSLDIDEVFTTEAEFNMEISALMASYATRAHYTGNEKVKYDVTVTDTSRYVAGATATRPSIMFDVPAGYIEEWSEDGDAGDLIKQNFNVMAVDEIGVTDAPMEITVVNNVASY